MANRSCINIEDYNSLKKTEQMKLQRLFNIFGYIPCQKELKEALKDEPGLALLLRNIVDEKFFNRLIKIDSYKKYVE